MSNLGPCFLNLDVAILADISKSMNETHRAQLTTFVNDLVTKLGISSGGKHFGLITFGPDATLHNDFNDAKFHNETSFKNLVSQAVGYVPDKWGTRIDLAMNLAATQLFIPAGGDRPDAKNVLLLFTDGEQFIGKWDTRPLIPSSNLTATLEVTDFIVYFKTIPV